MEEEERWRRTPRVHSHNNTQKKVSLVSKNVGCHGVYMVYMPCFPDCSAPSVWVLFEGDNDFQIDGLWRSAEGCRLVALITDSTRVLFFLMYSLLLLLFSHF